MRPELKRFLILESVLAVIVGAAIAYVLADYPQHAPVARAPVKGTHDYGNPAIQELASADDLHRQLMRRRHDANFMAILVDKEFDTRDLSELSGQRASLFRAMQDESFSDSVRRRLAWLSVCARTELMAGPEDYSTAVRTIYRTTDRDDAMLRTTIMENYVTFLLMHYGPIDYEQAFAGWKLTEAEDKTARSIYGAVRARPRP